MLTLGQWRRGAESLTTPACTYTLLSTPQLRQLKTSRLARRRVSKFWYRNALAGRDRESWFASGPPFVWWAHPSFLVSFVRTRGAKGRNFPISQTQIFLSQCLVGFSVAFLLPSFFLRQLSGAALRDGCRSFSRRLLRSFDFSSFSVILSSVSLPCSSSAPLATTGSCRSSALNFYSFSRALSARRVSYLPSKSHASRLGSRKSDRKKISCELSATRRLWVLFHSPMFSPALLAWLRMESFRSLAQMKFCTVLSCGTSAPASLANRSLIELFTEPLSIRASAFTQPTEISSRGSPSLFILI